MEKYKKVSKFLSVNTKVNVEILSGDYRGVYDSRIEDFSPEGIVISMPSENGVPMPVRDKTKLAISYFAEGGRFSFNTQVIKRFVDGIPLLLLTMPDEIKRKELREYFRVETRLKVKLKYIINQGTDSQSEKMIDCNIIDISGGGVKIVADDSVESGIEVSVLFADTPIEIESVVGKVVRCIQINEKFQFGVEFSKMRNADRDKIIKYVFQRQMELRKMLG